MHIELVGCTSAGKTTLTQRILDVGKRQGIDVILGDDFVLRKLHLMWVKNEFIRRRIMEICSVYICYRERKKYRTFIRFVLDMIRQAPGSRLYKASLARAVFRKIGIYEIIRRFNPRGQMVLVDNEGIVQAAHILFVHSNGSLNADLSNFVELAPLPDMIAYLRTPESIILERTLKRGHRRISKGSESKARHFIHQATTTFDTLQNLPQISERMFVLDSQDKTVTKLSSRNGQLVDRARDLMQTSIQDPQSNPESDQMTPATLSDTHCLELIERLLDRLNARGVRYCHWKSNTELDKSMNGESDLDFFVGRESAASMFEVLDELGFKTASIKYGPETPGVTHHYGLDLETGKLVHVHLFTNLITGESFVKSHRLPLEKMLLENCKTQGAMPVITRPAESVLFVLRTFIKYGSLPDMLRLYKKPESVLDEWKWLQEEGDMDLTLSLLKEHCPAVSESLFSKCVAAIENNHSFLKRVMLARRMRRKLRKYAESGYIGRLFAYFQVVWALVRRRLDGKIKNKGLRSGGVVIAIVGPDATGKSTTVSETRRWLGKVFALRCVHVGKPPASWITSPFSVALPFARRILPRFRRSQVQTHSSDKEPVKESSSLFYAVRALTLAWDRSRLLIKVARSKADGDFIICDRYPSEVTGAMDSPRLRERSGKGGVKNALFNWIVRAERKLYERMPPPDIAIQLTVSLETAKKRNQARVGDDRDADEFIEIRHRNARDWQKSGTQHYYKVSTEQSVADTILTIKKAVWESL